MGVSWFVVGYVSSYICNLGTWEIREKNGEGTGGVLEDGKSRETGVCVYAF